MLTVNMNWLNLWVIKKARTIPDDFMEIDKEPGHELNEKRVDQEKELCNVLMKKD